MGQSIIVALCFFVWVGCVGWPVAAVVADRVGVLGFGRDSDLLLRFADAEAGLAVCLFGWEH